MYGITDCLRGSQGVSLCCPDDYAYHWKGVSVAEGLDLAAAQGEELVLHAQASDPDGDAVSISWQRYADADSCAAEVALSAEGDACTVHVPVDAALGDTIHIICRATDEGNGRDEYMVNYARVILTVAAE